ncbi:MAG: hypothetical protein GTN40_01120 [Candidatus Aenigmarchaeota archaeon]|nr:hypothetical protein [Candidatus Aenigmarchaeota archaeon]
MRLSYLFIFLTIITIILTILYLFGYDILDLIMAMITVDFLSLGAIIEHQRRFPSKTIKKLSGRVDNIENICNNIYRTLGSNPEFEEKFKKQKNDMSYVLDKVIEGSKELEKKINGFGKVLDGSKIKIAERNEEKEYGDEQT